MTYLFSTLSAAEIKYKELIHQQQGKRIVGIKIAKEYVWRRIFVFLQSSNRREEKERNMGDTDKYPILNHKMR
jgi:hypothetical protein